MSVEPVLSTTIKSIPKSAPPAPKLSTGSTVTLGGPTGSGAKTAAKAVDTINTTLKIANNIARASEEGKNLSDASVCETLGVLTQENSSKLFKSSAPVIAGGLLVTNPAMLPPAAPVLYEMATSDKVPNLLGDMAKKGCYSLLSKEKK